MKKMQSLFDVEIVSPEDRKAGEFITKLTKKGFIEQNEIYLKNYINADIAIAFAHIKKAYKSYVCKGKWPETKFEEIIYIIAKNRKLLIPNVFIMYGTQYDEGKLTRDINLERRKYQGVKKKDENEISKEEQELLDYIAKNGGQ